MSNFLRVAAGVDTFPLLQSLMRQQLWGLFGPANVVTLRDFKKDSTELVNFPAFDMLPQAAPLVFGTMQLVQGQLLGRVRIFRLGPGHSGGWSDDSKLESYYCVLTAGPGARILKGEESVPAETGSAWWVAGGEDKFVNDAQNDLLVLAVEIEPWAPSSYMPEGVEA